MPVKRCLLPGQAIRSLDDLYDELARQLNFPDHFGRNLDALWDVLTTDIEGPVEVVWENAASSRSAMGNDFERVATLLRDVAAERKDYSFVLRDL